MFNKISMLIACGCLLVAGGSAAQDYRVTAERGTAWGCLRLPEAKDMLDFYHEAESYDDPAMKLGMLLRVAESLDFYIDAELCAIYESKDVVAIVGEDDSDPEWVQVKEKNRWRNTREMWSRREWFEPVP